MFTNLAICGTKCYMLFDVEEAQHLGKHNKKIDIHTGMNSKNKNKYQDIINGRISSEKLTFKEFLSLKRSFFAVISSFGDLANFILVPSCYAHEVFTVGTGDDETYGGLSGFAMAQNYPKDKQDQLHLLFQNALS